MLLLFFVEVELQLKTLVQEESRLEFLSSLAGEFFRHGFLS